MKGWKIAASVMLVVLVSIQWIPTYLNQGDLDPPKDFMTLYSPSAHIGTLLRTACYDCHSNHTDYPWYSKVQPVAMFLENHITQGKKELNLSEFGDYSPRRRKSKIKSMSSQVEDGDMPLTSYTLIHRDANLSPEDRKELAEWLSNLEGRH